MQDARATGWIDLLGSDPVPWLLASGKPAEVLALGSSRGGAGTARPPRSPRS